MSALLFENESFSYHGEVLRGIMFGLTVGEQQGYWTEI